ncbi:MAG: serpin family protein [Polyangiales bacterium]
MSLAPLGSRLRLSSLAAVSALLGITALAGADAKMPAPPPPPKAKLAPMPAGFVSSNDAFATDLYRELAKKDGNLFFSPASISTALAMTYAGAKGTTATQMAKALHFDLPAASLHPAFGALLARLDSSGPKLPELKVANRLWGNKGGDKATKFEGPFLKTTNDDYGAKLEMLDFVKATEPSRKTINDWVTAQTKGKINDLLPAGTITMSTRLVLTNAIYFKGKWVDEFEKTATKDAPFTLAAGTTKKVPLMHQTLHARYAENADAQLVELPYVSADPDHAVTMIVLLPRPAVGLAKLEAKLDAKQLSTWVGALGGREVDLTIPRFKTTSSFELSKTLSTLGMPIAFDDKADFTGITKEEPVWISAVVHKAFVDVNEEGTEAAAATGVVVSTGEAVSVPPAVFRADRPFVFLLRDVSTGSILFMGRVADPS